MTLLPLVSRHGEYAIVSGYISILLGLERPAQDIGVVAIRGNPEEFEDAARKKYSIALAEGKFKKFMAWVRR